MRSLPAVPRSKPAHLISIGILPMQLADNVKHATALVNIDRTSPADPLAHCPQPTCAHARSGRRDQLFHRGTDGSNPLSSRKSPLRTCCCQALGPSADGSATASIDIRCRLASRYCAKSERNSRPHRLSGQLVRPARIEDADVPAELVDYAGEGLPSYLWHKIAGPGETAQDVGRKRAA